MTGRFQHRLCFLPSDFSINTAPLAQLHHLRQALARVRARAPPSHATTRRTITTYSTAAALRSAQAIIAFPSTPYSTPYTLRTGNSAKCSFACPERCLCARLLRPLSLSLQLPSRAALRTAFSKPPVSWPPSVSHHAILALVQGRLWSDPGAIGITRYPLHQNRPPILPSDKSKTNKAALAATHVPKTLLPVPPQGTRRRAAMSARQPLSSGIRHRALRHLPSLHTHQEPRRDPSTTTNNVHRLNRALYLAAGRISPCPVSSGPSHYQPNSPTQQIRMPFQKGLGPPTRCRYSLRSPDRVGKY